MSFKQAKELVEKIELTELTLNKTAQDIENSAAKFNKALQMQEKLIEYFPKVDLKLNVMRLLVALNIGFIFGLIVGKYII